MHETTTRLLLVGFGAFGQAIGKALSIRSDLAISVCTRSPICVPSYVSRAFVGTEGVPIVDFEVVLLCLPSATIGDALSSMCKRGPPTGIIVSCSKGMDPDAALFISQVIQSRANTDAIAVLSGASFAHEMMEGSPVYLTLACANLIIGRELKERIQTENLRFELAADVRGLEIVGVAKNVLAIGAGIADGLNLGENFRATYIARGVAELSRVVSMLGGDSSTIASVGALSDIILTCSSDRSRNYRLGRNIAVRREYAAPLAEGRHSAAAFMRFLHRHDASSFFFDTVNNAMNDPSLILNTLYS